MNHCYQSLIYAHRGANREAAENTRTAFERSLAYPIDGIETDIQLTRDGVAVLWHDRFLDKLGMKDKRIDDFDHAELQAMDFAAHFAGKAPLPNPPPQAGEGANEALRASSCNEGVMSLREFLDAYRTRCRLLLEIKNRDWEPVERHEAKVRQTLELVGAASGDQVLVSSFNLGSLVYAHRIAPQFPLVFNLEPEHDAAFAREVLDAQPFLYGLCVHIATLNEAMVGAVCERGKRIAVYTCNSDEQIDRALALGVDILISDVPQKALALRERMEHA
ncbi:MAG: glycerophosphodiester phosphodiesterase [Gallionella sp.]|jgi:glycerophosphoryl diester phosphodiesterase|nr:glycerophosphodiester phosphodiesterase [Gallionella sp.]MCK9355478.1 glycerophosphodiester phosphodiesterase [Gallionella sp.]